MDDENYNEITNTEPVSDSLPHNVDSSAFIVAQNESLTIDASAQNISPEAVAEEAPISQQPLPSHYMGHDAIYSETIRSKAAKHCKSHIRFSFALICILSVIGGIALGMALSIGITFTGGFIFPSLKNNIAKRDINSKAEQAFSFIETNSSSASAQSGGYVLNTGFSQIVSDIEPSVVCITSVVLNNRSMFSQSSEPLGSGIIFHYNKEKVYIVTNNHVINNAVSVKISIAGSTDVSASLVGKQPDADLAVISVLWEDLEKIGIYEIKTAKFGNSDNMRVGDIVLAIGNALGEGNTATLGIISAVDKKININNINLSVIQTDAAINPGNSGGPLVNTNGEVIGINTAKLLQSSIEGTGYSITSKTAVPVIQELLNTKLDVKPFLGIQGEDVIGNSESNNLVQYGVYIVSVIQDTAAEKCGLMPGDIIVGFNRETVKTMEQLSKIISQRSIGENVKIDIIRKGKTEITIDAVLADNSASNF